MIYLRQSTASQEVLIGPFIDTAGAAVTSLSISNTDIKIFKAGATSESNKNSGGATHIAAGRYYCVLDATDTDTIGSGEINVAVSGALPVRRPFTILHANVYDWLFGSTAPNTTAPLDAAGIRSAVGLSSANLDTQLDALPTATENASQVRTELTTELGRIDAAISTRSTYAGADTSGTTTLLSRLSSDRAGYLDKLNVSGTLAHSDAAATYRADVSGLSTLTAQDVADAVWDEAISGHLDSGSTGAALNAAGSAGDPWSTPLPGAYGSGTAGKLIGDNLDAAVSSRLAAGSYTAPPSASAVATQVRTELTTELGRIDVAVSTRLASSSYAAPLDAAGVRAAVGLASANLDTQLSTIDGVVDAILDDTGTSGVVVASSSKTGYALASGGLDAIAVESGVNARQALSVCLASAAGVLSGAATETIVIRAGANPGTTRITATVDEDGNRSSVTLSLPS